MLELTKPRQQLVVCIELTKPMRAALCETFVCIDSAIDTLVCVCVCVYVYLWVFSFANN